MRLENASGARTGPHEPNVHWLVFSIDVRRSPVCLPRFFNTSVWGCEIRPRSTLQYLFSCTLCASFAYSSAAQALQPAQTVCIATNTRSPTQTSDFPQQMSGSLANRRFAPQSTQNGARIFQHIGSGRKPLIYGLLYARGRFQCQCRRSEGARWSLPTGVDATGERSILHRYPQPNPSAVHTPKPCFDNTLLYRVLSCVDAGQHRQQLAGTDQADTFQVVCFFLGAVPEEERSRV